MNKIKLLHMYPNMLDLYGDSGNVEIIKYRCKKRDIELEVSSHIIGDDTDDFSQYDIVYLGGGADLEQQILADDLLKCKDAVRKAYENGASKEYTASLCLGYVEAVIEKMCKAVLEEKGEMPVVFAGGVMSDRIIRDQLASQFDAYFAEPAYSADNASGIAYLCSIMHNKEICC